MKREVAWLRLSATDLANHLACRHATTLDRGLADGLWKAPDFFRPEADVLAQRGLEHENAYLVHLERPGRRVTRLPEGFDGRRGLERTLAAMYQGDDVIAQATLADGRWFGRADVLLRVERRSGLGAWSYEPLDTKLAQETRAGAILQLCLYADLLGRLQGAPPEFMYVVPRRPEFPLESYRVDDHMAYYRFVRRRLETVLAGEVAGTYPEPVAHCDICRWFPRCDRRRRDDDHLGFVAGLSRLQARELQARSIATLARLAAEPLPIAWKPARGARESYRRVREQARIQLAGRTENRPLHEMLDLEPERGLACLPAPSPGDVFLDLEADPFIDEGGLEYLFGWATTDPGAGDLAYHHRWALDRASEKEGFETAIDTILARWSADPGMHVYHYSPYEPGALKRLMGRHATREADIDRLLRAGRFVDLHSIVRQSLRASVEEYSIKQLERFYSFERLQPLERAGTAQRLIQRNLELGLPVDTAGEDAAIVVAYNRDDCVSAAKLRDWLEALRAGRIAHGAEIPRPPAEPGEPSRQVSEREEQARRLAERLMSSVPAEPQERSPEQRALALLADLLDWHRREDKAPWWEFFRLRELGEEDLIDEVAALGGLEFVERLGDKPLVDRYRFPQQETRIRSGAELQTPQPEGQKFGVVKQIDLVSRTVDIEKVRKVEELHPRCVFEHQVFRTDLQARSLLRLGEWIAMHGIDAEGPYRAARDLLLNRAPRIAGGNGGSLALPDENGVDAARRLGRELAHGTLAVQGPPGSGKTYTGARMIVDLVRGGRRVGVCAASHKVIANLLREVRKAAHEEEIEIRCLRKAGKDDGDEPEGSDVPVTGDNDAAREALRSRAAQVLGGTAWLWAREDFVEAADVLFVDEAGQMSLANVLAVAPAAKNLVLLGDPQQLDQPVQGYHPPGSAVSALEHVLGGEPTIAPERGLFLAETWRLAPPLCAFTSELFYAGRLRPREDLERQALLGDTPFAGAGLGYVPVAHDSNQGASAEEVAVIADLVHSLVQPGIGWRDRHGTEHPLGLADILVIAPYNAQVADLAAALPRGARVGTVDKFQGQEAPVVLYSMTTSSAEDAPRGMEFLYSPNRFNVATSRAKCACIVVGNPRLFEPDCRNPRQIRLANAYCRYLELARVQEWAPRLARA